MKKVKSKVSNVLILLAVAGLTLGTTAAVRHQRIEAFRTFISARGCEPQRIVVDSEHPGSKLFKEIYICGGDTAVPIPKVLF